MNKIVAAIMILLLMLNSAPVMAEKRWISDENKERFADLLTELVSAYESPTGEDDDRINATLDAIQRTSKSDYEIASAITSHWRDVYLDDDYPLFVHRAGEMLATSLEETRLRDSNRHAFVVLGYELKNGKMQSELVGRCDAAAAAARSYPSTILVCSGGATGDNNPMMHTEAGMMKDYLVKTCGIDASRIVIDEQAKTTLENAKNTMEMLKQQGIETMTIVTSTYHQRWGQVVYNAVATLYHQAYGYSVGIIGNYCYEIEPTRDSYRNDDRIAVYQIAQLLDIPMEKE